MMIVIGWVPINVQININDIDLVMKYATKLNINNYAMTRMMHYIICTGSEYNYHNYATQTYIDLNNYIIHTNIEGFS